MGTENKIKEDRLRRMARRQGYETARSRQTTHGRSIGGQRCE